MSANVAITDTFDQWRTKSNKFIVMTQSAGSDDFIKLNNTTRNYNKCQPMFHYQIPLTNGG